VIASIRYEGMALWRERVFSALRATPGVRWSISILPADRVIRARTQIEI